MWRLFFQKMVESFKGGTQEKVWTFGDILDSTPFRLSNEIDKKKLSNFGLNGYQSKL